MRDNKRYGDDNHFYRGGSRSSGRAHNLVDKAIARGKLIPAEACEECGTSGTMADGRSIIQAHHDDYNRPLDVRWLCQGCHHEWHKHNIARGETRGTRSGATTVVSGGFP